jgi:hypothetical protein
MVVGVVGHPSRPHQSAHEQRREGRLDPTRRSVLARHEELGKSANIEDAVGFEQGRRL